MARDKPWREIRRDHAGNRIDPEDQLLPREKIAHSRKEEGAHNTVSLEVARQHSAHINRPLTEAEKKARAPIGWVIRQEEEPQ